MGSRGAGLGGGVVLGGEIILGGVGLKDKIGLGNKVTSKNKVLTLSYGCNLNLSRGWYSKRLYNKFKIYLKSFYYYLRFGFIIYSR